MTPERKRQVMAVLVLVLVIGGISIGFAAFSNTLTVSSNTAVNPNSSDFNVCFTTTTNSCSEGPISSNTLSSIPIDKDQHQWINKIFSAYVSGGTTLTVDLIDGKTYNSVNFTGPGYKAVYTFNIYNPGKYTAYLNSVSFGTLTCSYVDQAETHGVNLSTVCSDFYTILALDINKNGIFGNLVPMSDTADSSDKTFASNMGVANPSTSGISIPSNDYIPARFAIVYPTNGKLADGDFTISTNNAVTLNFSTVQ